MIAAINTGHWNSNVIIMLVLFFLAPIALYYLKLIFSGPVVESPFIELEVEAPEKPVTYEDVKQAALRRAANGDNSARNWVMKHVYGESTQTKQASLTERHVIDDTVTALVALKMKKSEAQQKVLDLAMKKKYNSVNELLVASLRK